MNDDKAGFVAVLLAGGLSRRMGEDKAFLQAGGRALWQHQLDTLLQLSPQATCISARPGQFDAVQLPSGVQAMPDETEGAGALPALAQLLAAPPENLPRLVVPVDMPQLDAPFLARAFPVGGKGIAYRMGDELQPLPALLTPGCAEVAANLAAQGERSLRAFCQECEAQGLLEIQDLPANDVGYYINLNRPEDRDAFNGT